MSAKIDIHDALSLGNLDCDSEYVRRHTQINGGAKKRTC